jgi:hypothetical protein
MFLGHNFDTCFGFYRSVKRGAEDVKMPTWANIKGFFLPTADLDEEECFFTNFYLGAMIHPEPSAGEKKKTKNTGRFKCSQDYRIKCIEALRIQVEIARPRVIAPLGSCVPSAFAEAFPAYAPHAGDGVAETQSKQPSSGHSLELSKNMRVQVVCLFHPANPRSLESHRAQGSLLRSAVRAWRD